MALLVSFSLSLLLCLSTSGEEKESYKCWYIFSFLIVINILLIKNELEFLKLCITWKIRCNQSVILYKLCSVHIILNKHLVYISVLKGKLWLA